MRGASACFGGWAREREHVSVGMWLSMCDERGWYVRDGIGCSEGEELVDWGGKEIIMVPWRVE